MYNNKLVASIKANGKILREFKDTVYIPFGSEYSFLIKNLHTTRALINVFIDGDDVVPGGLVVNAGKEIDLERYIKNDNLKEGNRFKFIERTEGIEQHRGVKLEDGLVRIEFQFELPPMKISSLPQFQRDDLLSQLQNTPISGSTGFGVTTPLSGSNDFKITASGSAGYYGTSIGGSNLTRGISSSVNNISVASLQSMVTPASFSAPIHNDAGITVAGSKSTQSFSTTYMGALDPEKHSIVLKLLGETPDNKPVLAPVTVKAKPKCTTCGHTNKATAQFCNKCGTALVIYA
jgi:hypothetical protein